MHILEGGHTVTPAMWLKNLGCHWISMPGPRDDSRENSDDIQ